MKFCYSSDTFPNKWWMEYARDADISIHEAFITPESLVAKQNFTPEAALNVGTQIHTSPAQFGKVRRGDILICRSTAATWTPLFDIVAGLVSEAGGVLSHPAVIAREYGLPAVVGVHRATELISDGDAVRIDGAAGAVYIA